MLELLFIIAACLLIIEMSFTIDAREHIKNVENEIITELDDAVETCLKTTEKCTFTQNVYK